MNLSRFTAVLICALAALSSSAEGPPPSKVVTALVKQQQVSPTSRLVGVIDFDRVSNVSGEVSGLIVQQRTSEGTEVKQGETLVELNTDFIEMDMEIKRKQQAQADADLQKVGSSLKRLESLLQKNSASRQAYDEALYDHRSLQKRRETLGLELKRLQLQLEKSSVLAPFDGIVLEKLKENGEWIAPGTAICTLASSSDLVVKVAISENLVRFQKPGQQLTVDISALDIKLSGKTLAISPVARQRSKSVTLKISIPYNSGMARNMSASLEVPSGDEREMLLVPRDALIRNKGKDFVYTVEEGKAKMLPVNVLTRLGEQAGIEPSPLQPGMQVIIDGNDRLRPNQAVQVQES
ncbi:MAG: efflux RND transporter periplasmic adaptor subunit [Gammaproteobacteria bacterium]|nr:efflux RND transporter periplasmic adaptor subunit [Gammaproteobacteria bacterium]